MKLNPFRPSSIAGPGAFAGRFAELKALDQGLYQTKHSNPWHFLIHGERGIGKSSLLCVEELTAKGECPAVEEDLDFNFLTVSICLEPNDSYAELIRKVGGELSTQLGQRERLKTALKSVWEFVSRWDLGGVKYTAKDKLPEQSEMMNSLVETFVAANSSLGEEIDGFLLLIDEADKGCVSAQLGEFIKIFTEQLTRRRCERVSLGLAGISDVIDGLKQSHESSVRILHHMHLEPLLPTERLEVLQRVMQVGNKKNARQTAMQPDAAQRIAQLSEGYPHFIQQYGYSDTPRSSPPSLSVSPCGKST